MQTLAAAGSAHEGSSFVSSYDLKPDLSPIPLTFEKLGKKRKKIQKKFKKYKGREENDPQL
jgi:hypothetical protein